MTPTKRHLEAVSEAMGFGGEITADVMDRPHDEDCDLVTELDLDGLDHIGELQHLKHACGNYLQLAVRYVPCPKCQQTMCLYCAACRKVFRLCPVTADEGYALELD